MIFTPINGAEFVLRWWRIQTSETTYNEGLLKTGIEAAYPMEGSFSETPPVSVSEAGIDFLVERGLATRADGMIMLTRVGINAMNGIHLVARLST